MITSLHMGCDDLEAHVHKLEAKYRKAEQRETRAEDWYADGADIVLVGYGIIGRILKAVVAEARSLGMNVGLLRPVTLYPFPTKDFERLAKCAKAFVVVEMSNGQLLDDVRLALNGARPVEFYSRVGGNVPSHEEVFRFVEKQVRKYLAASPKEEQMVHV